MANQFADELLDELGNYAYDPLGFVMWAFPWGEPGELAKFSGPDKWQKEILAKLRDGIITTNEAILLAVTSGHGVGKSALVAWIVWWAFSTFPDTRGVVTSNTETQLKTKTWVEIAKWYRLFIAKDLFKCTATALFSKDEQRAREWRIDIVPWSERNTEAFAGLHNQGKRILIVYDEASGIPPVIWEVTEGALTDLDTEIIWVAFGNPTKNSGRFRECFAGGRFFHRWKTLKVDSREVKITNKEQIEKWVKDYGEDSDFVRVRVRGEFPRQDADSFISREKAQQAALRQGEFIGNIEVGVTDVPVVLGVDVARFGNAMSVIYPRQGRDARSRPPIFLSGYNTMQLAMAVRNAMATFGAIVACVDEGGVGGGVVDRLMELKVNVVPVQFSGKPWMISGGGVRYANRRAEIYGLLRDWLDRGYIPEMLSGLEIPFPEELSSPTYSFIRKDEILLESKEHMRLRGVPSPDASDALACTFAFEDLQPAQTSFFTTKPITDYNPFDEKRIYQ